jgi:hypothetical protein
MEAQSWVESEAGGVGSGGLKRKKKYETFLEN